MSATAQSTNGTKRLFNRDDIAIFALIAEMKAAGKLFSDIHAALTNNQRGTIPNTELAPPERGRLAAALAEVERYKAVLTDALNDKQKAVGQVELLERQLLAAHAEIARLNRLLGKLE